MDAELHLIEAAKCIRQGEQFYAKAADEIQAAMEQDTTLGYRRVGERVGKSGYWCRKLVQWRTSGIVDAGPFSEAAGKPNRDESGARKVMTEADPEVIERIVTGLPPERQAVIAAALPTSSLTPTTEGTAAQYLRDPAPDPSEYEIDRLALGLARQARLLRDRVRRFGVRTMNEPDDTLRDLDSAIADANEARAAVREFVNERALS